MLVQPSRFEFDVGDLKDEWIKTDFVDWILKNVVNKNPWIFNLNSILK